MRWCGADNKKYGKVFETKNEAERYALELQSRVNLGKADKPQKVTLHEFICEHAKVMKGQGAYATLQVQMRALRLFENYIGGSIVLYRIQPRHAEAFIAHRLASGLKTAMVNKLAFCKQVVEEYFGQNAGRLTLFWHFSLFSAVFRAKTVDSLCRKLLFYKWLEDFGGVAQLVRAWDS